METYIEVRRNGDSRGGWDVVVVRAGVAAETIGYGYDADSALTIARIEGWRQGHIGIRVAEVRQRTTEEEIASLGW